MGGDIDYATLERNVQDAEKALRECPGHEVLKAAQTKVNQARRALLDVRRTKDGEDIRQRLLGQTVVSVGFLYRGSDKLTAESETMLDPGVCIELSNGVVIEAAYAESDSDGQLEISKPHK